MSVRKTARYTRVMLRFKSFVSSVSVVSLALLVVLLASCQAQQVTESVPEIIAEYPHDTSAFTQGLELHDGYLYESTGLRGESSLREVILESGEVLRILPLANRYFAEGLTVVDDTLIQLTWQAGVAFRYDIDTFDVIAEYTYPTQGWGLCFDGDSLYMSDGSATLFRRDPDSFALLEEIPVTLRGAPVVRLNELECVGDSVYANVWQEDQIVEIDKDSGNVVRNIDASNLRAELDPEESRGIDVLNGIAYNPDTDTFYVTGKWWPSLFEVRFVEVP